MSARADQWFDVDRAGFAANMSAYDRARAVAELLQNAWDADGVTTVDVTLARHARGVWSLVVDDDAPDGFADLHHAWTLYARSEKRDDPTKRGRFNEGEKKVLALCRSATVISTTGAAFFNEDGSREVTGQVRAAGSRFSALIHLTAEQGDAAVAWLRRCIPPAGIATTINGEVLHDRTPVKSLTLALPTVVDGPDGLPTERVRTSTVDLHEPEDGKAWLYEMGLPVVRLADDRWSVDVGAKVLLNRDRDNVRPAWLRRLRAAVADETVDLLDGDEAAARWVSAAIAAPEIGADTVRAVIAKRFGPKAVVFDPSDREANDIAASKGYTIVQPRAFDREGWAAIRAAGALLPAGQVTPSPGVAFDADGKPPIDPAKWTAAQRACADYAVALASELLGATITVDIHRRLKSRNGSGVIACYRPGHLSFNAAAFHGWSDQHAVDELLIHEFAHHVEANHFSARFVDEACRLGARLRDSTLRLRSTR